MYPQIFLFPFNFCAAPNMAGSNSSVHGGHRSDRDPPVSRAEMERMAESLMEAMGRMLDERIPAAGGRGQRRHQEENHSEESSVENFGFGHGFGRFGEEHGGRGGGRHPDNRHGGRRADGRRVHFEDEEFEDQDHEEGYDDDENPFARGRRFGQHHHHRRADFEDREYHRGCRHYDDPDNIARVKLNVPRFTGKENADEFLEWVEQCDQIFRIHNLSDQRRVNLHQLNSMDML